MFNKIKVNQSILIGAVSTLLIFGGFVLAQAGGLINADMIDNHKIYSSVQGGSPQYILGGSNQNTIYSYPSNSLRVSSALMADRVETTTQADSAKQAVSLARAGQSCPAGEFLFGIDPSGNALCEEPVTNGPDFCSCGGLTNKINVLGANKQNCLLNFSDGSLKNIDCRWPSGGAASLTK